MGYTLQLYQMKENFISYKWCKFKRSELCLIKYRGISKNLAKIDFLAGSNSEAIQHIMLKLTMGECLKRHYVRTKFHQNP